MTITSNRSDHVEFGRRQCVVRVGNVSARASLRAITVVASLLAGTLVIAVLAIGIGKYTVAPGDVLGVLMGTNTSFDRVVILEWRIPRMLMALLIGAALGLSGAIFQALTRNALGSPDIIGINSGAYTGALIVIAGIGGGYYVVAAGALVGGLVTAVVVYALSYRNGLAGYRLIVVGIAVSAVLNSVNPMDRDQTRLPRRRHRIGVATRHAERTELDAGTTHDGLPGHGGRDADCAGTATAGVADG
jgi:iron complex transport system permease protein